MTRTFKITILIYIVLLLATFGFMVIGRVNFIGTITLYVTVLLLLISAIRQLKKITLIEKYYAEVRLVIFTLIITFLIADLSLRYVIKLEAYLTYPERNGERHYFNKTLLQKFRWINSGFTKSYIKGWFLSNKPNSTRQLKHKEFNYTYKYNQDGIPDKPSVAKQKNEIRVLALGDSFTEGIGTPQDSSWPVLLENLLNSVKSDTFYNVINGGVSGSDPFYASYFLKYRLLKYKPDVVLIAINNSDIDDIIESGGYERFLSDSTCVVRNSPWWEPVYGASIIFRMLVHNVFHYTFHLIPQQEENNIRFNAPKKLIEPIEEFIRLSNENKFKLVFIFHPNLWELQRNNFALGETYSLIKEDAQVSAINLFDEERTYFNKNNLSPEDYFWRIDAHNNSKGYQLWAEIVFQKLKEEKIIL